VDPVEPLVSCLMVTQAARAAVAPRAIRAFNRQAYSRRELVIVSVDDCSTLVPLVEPPGRARFWRAPAAFTLGDLRNAAVDESRGEYVATWDDDDWSHPERLARQLAALRASDADGCALGRCIFAREGEGEYVVVHAWPHTGYASLVARRSAMPRYPSLPRKEDHVIHTMKIVPLDDPGLYVRTLHAGNTCDTAYAVALMRRLTMSRLSASEVVRLRRDMGEGSE
jgi:glycosyltransferase involved in cell wall biosynthesis